MQNTIQYLYKFSISHGGVIYAWFSAMHTRVDIVLCSRQSEDILKRVIKAVFEMLYRLEKMANYYYADSELSRLNEKAFMCPQPVSQELYDMLSFCVDCYDRTEGCFDITVHSANHTFDSIRNIHFSQQEHSLHFSRLGISLNLSGFLKGYALEKIRNLLQLYEVENALINLGNSSILALGYHPMADGWKVGFGQVVTSNQRKYPDLLLQNECLTISGNESDERKHIINPRNGKLIVGRKEVAVVTESGIIGEVLSTSLFVANSFQRKSLEAEFHPRLTFYF